MNKFDLIFIEPDHVHAFPINNEHVYQLLTFLHQNTLITKIKIAHDLLSFTLPIDLSLCKTITDLRLVGTIVCTSLPPNLLKLECDTSNLLPPFHLPLSTTTFCFTELFCFTTIETLVEPVIENNPHLEKIIFNKRNLKNQKELFVTISKRPTPLQHLEVANHVYDEDELQCAFTHVICLEASIDPSSFSYVYNDEMKLKKLICKGRTSLSKMIGWTQNLEEIVTCLIACDFSELEGFLKIHKNLKKIGFYNIDLPCLRHFINLVHLFPPHLLCEFSSCSATYQQDIFRHCVYLARGGNMAVWKQKNYLVQMQKNLFWIPRLHTNFPIEAQKTLSTLVLGLTKLKKFTKEKEPLVHVDPACIEWVFENFDIKSSLF